MFKVYITLIYSNLIYININNPMLINLLLPKVN